MSGNRVLKFDSTISLNEHKSTAIVNETAGLLCLPAAGADPTQKAKVGLVYVFRAATLQNTGQLLLRHWDHEIYVPDKRSQTEGRPTVARSYSMGTLVPRIAPLKPSRHWSCFSS